MKAKFILRATLISLLVFSYPGASRAFVSVGISVGFAPPAIPVYVQPACPVPGYIWTPGYWAYSPVFGDYYWVPGAWIAPPTFGFLWTPGYWAFSDGIYLWHEGYWGPHVGFYGGINYGFGYFGAGFVGGYWRGHDFFYNRAVSNVRNVSIAHVYNKTVMNNFGENRASFNGPHGVEAQPSAADMRAAHEAHRGTTASQRSVVAAARASPSARASSNHGNPPLTAQRTANGGHTPRLAATASNKAPPHSVTTHSGTPAAHQARVAQPPQISRQAQIRQHSSGSAPPHIQSSAPPHVESRQHVEAPHMQGGHGAPARAAGDRRSPGRGRG